MPVFVHRAEVARAEPPVLGKNLCGGFFVLVVAEHNHGAFDEYLAHTGGVGIEYFCLNPRKRLTYGIRKLKSVVVADYERRTLRKPVADVHGHTEGLEILDNLRVNRGGTRDNHTQPPAEILCYLGKNLVAYVYADGTRRLGQCLAEGERNARHLALACFFEYAQVEFFKHQRHGNKQRRLKLLHVFHYIAQPLAERNAAARVYHHHKAQTAFVCMMKR